MPDHTTGTAQVSDPIADERLKPARDLLASGGIRVLCLDVFDTLVWRRVPEPQDVFLLLGRRLAEQGKLAGHISAQGFADLRQAAERAAREKVQAVTGYREIKLTDIYALIPDHVFTAGFDTAARIQAELACEGSLLILDRDVAQLMKTARVSNAKVVLASDTYFTETELCGLLTAAGLKDQSLIDRVFVSCEIGKPKYRDMFDVILKDLGLTPAQLLHVGDTLEADINPCRARGIAVAPYDKWGFSPRVQLVEFPQGTQARAQRAALLGDHGDFGLSGVRSRLAHRAPAALSKDLKPYWIYGAAVLAPVFAGFARWVVQQAAGKKRVFGLMREGRFLKRVVEATAKQLGANLMVDELWLSRRAVVRAALTSDDLSALSEAILLAPGTTTDEILASLGLSRADLKEFLPAYDKGQVDAVGALTAAIAATPGLRDKVLAGSADLRANLLRGVARQLDGVDHAIVLDLGYAATIQSVLGRILAREQVGPKLTGLYLALNEKAMMHMRGGADLRAYLSDEGFLGATAALLSRTPDVLEHACMCREGSLAAFDAAGAPVLLANQRDEGQLAQMEAMQDGIIAGVGAVNALLGDLARTPGDCDELKGQVAQIISAALLYPTPQEAATIGAWRHEANFDLNDKRRLTDLGFDTRDLEYRGWPALQELGRHQVYWPAAALTAADPFLGSIFAGGLTSAYAAQHLGSGALLGGLIICPDLGVGFDSKRQGAMPLSVNAFGRGHIQVIVKPFGIEGYRRLRFTWPNARAIAQIDNVSAVYIGETQHRGAQVTQAVWSGDTEAASGVSVIEAGKPAEAVVTLDEAPPWPHALEVTIRFKYLRLDPMFGGK
jgi:FMN phosphatase YigB (HAD superfamily)